MGRRKDEPGTDAKIARRHHYLEQTRRKYFAGTDGKR